MSDNSSPSSQSFPDLYALLGIKPLERDVARIQLALKQLSGQIQTGGSAAGTDPKKLDRARKLFELGKQQLLDPQRKLKYDQQWLAVFGSSGQQSSRKEPKGKVPAARAASPLSWDLRELQSLLPKGDPALPFDPSSYAASQSLQAKSSYDADFAQLQSQLSGGSAVAVDQAAAKDADVVAEATNAVSAEVPQVPNQQVKESLLTIGASKLAPTISAPTVANHRRSAPKIAKRLRKRQEQGLLWGVIGSLVAVGIVLGIAYWLMPPAGERSLSATRRESVAASPSTNGPVPQSGNSPQTNSPRRSGLPSVPGFDAASPAPNNSAEEPPASQPTQPSMSTNTADTFSEQEPDATVPDEPMSMTTMTEATSSAPMTADALPSDPSTMDDPTTTEILDLTGEEREQWLTTMLEARRLIGQQQFGQADSQLELAQSAAKTPLQSQQLARLVTVRQLAEEFHQGLRRAITGMGAGETFTVGRSTPVSFVEATSDRLTLRIQGKNQSFAFTELPIGLAYGIVDMAMDRQHPRSLACKAAFALVHPAGESDLAINNAKKMIASAIAEGALAEDMAMIFDDDYQLK